jgi:P4 family phage/plasmid primase-like protien
MSDPLNPSVPVDRVSEFKRHMQERLRIESENIERRQLRELADQILKKGLFDKNKFIPVRFVNNVLGSYPPDTFITPMNDQGGDVVWRYHEDTGIYTPNGVPFIEKCLLTILGEDATTTQYAQIVKHLQVSTYTPPEAFEDVPEIIVLKNGSFNTLTGELGPHSPEYMAKNTLPVTYNKNADCPVFKKFLSEVIPDENNRRFIQEWFGYHLLKDYRFQRCVVLVGDGDNGKSTLLLVIIAFLGSENVASETLFRLSSNRFSPAELYGKLGNVSADIGPDEMKYTGVIKMLTGNDWITVERKNRDPFKMKNYGKLTFSCNQVPQTPDETLAFYKRFIVVPFGDPIPKEKQDPVLIEKLTTEAELSGIFNWAYEGLKSALKRGYLYESLDIQQKKEIYQNMSKPEYGFYSEYIEEDRESFELKQDILTAFYMYCKNKGFLPLSERAFIERFKKLAWVREYHPKLWTDENPQGKQYACWRGIKLSDAFKKTVYYTSRKDYLATVSNQKRIEDIDHIEGLHTPTKKSEIHMKEENPQYGQYGQYGGLVEDAKTFIQQLGGRAEVGAVKDHLARKGFSENDIADHVVNNWDEFARPDAWHIGLKSPTSIDDKEDPGPDVGEGEEADEE